MNRQNWLVMPADAPSRRQLVAGAVAFAGCGARPIRVWANAEDGISHSAESIHQEPVFQAIRKRVYEALAEAKQFDRIVQFSRAMQSGMALGKNRTEISRQVGGAFTLFGGHIIGRHVELVPYERIAQAWRVVDWHPGVYSIVKFELTEQGSGTKIIFDHAGFPVGKAQHLAEGWNAHYWEPLRKYLSS
jgi:activator of HSP90 ATPase